MKHAPRVSLAVSASNAALNAQFLVFTPFTYPKKQIRMHATSRVLLPEWDPRQHCCYKRGVDGLTDDMHRAFYAWYIESDKIL